MSIVIWFNGPSQKDLVETLPRQQIEIGCNYIEKFRPVDAVAAFDIGVVEKIKMKENVQYYTRSDSQMPNWNIIVNQIVSGGNSGVLACWVAVEKYPKQPVYILGCDWGINDNSSFDYIYKTGPKTKYTTHSKKKIENLFKNWEVYVVHDGNPDVSLPVIKKDSFLQLIQ
jgi:hypothetical protein